MTIEKIQEYKKVKEFLDDVCEKYLKLCGNDWKFYAGWNFSDDYPNCVVIHYGCFDWIGQYGQGADVIPMDVLIDFSKRYKKNE